MDEFKIEACSSRAVIHLAEPEYRQPPASAPPGMKLMNKLVRGRLVTVLERVRDGGS